MKKHNGRGRTLTYLQLGEGSDGARCCDGPDHGRQVDGQLGTQRLSCQSRANTAATATANTSNDDDDNRGSSNE